MKKAPEAFRTISEVSAVLDTPAHVLRFWESKFHQVRPVKRAGGRRYYRPDDVALIAGIKHLLQDRGMTIRGVQKIMQEEGVRHVIGLGRASGRMGAEAEEADEAMAEETAAAEALTGEVLDEEAQGDALTGEVLPADERDASVEELVDLAPDADAPEPVAFAGSAAPPPGPPADPSPDSAQGRLPLAEPEAEAGPAAPRLAQLLRRPAGAAPPAADLLPIVHRLDRLLDRMAEASGTRRW
jgi:DNA-binding transcriptional MerR regulator